jgi:hypothetical protein
MRNRLLASWAFFALVVAWMFLGMPTTQAQFSNIDVRLRDGFGNRITSEAAGMTRPIDMRMVNADGTRASIVPFPTVNGGASITETGPHITVGGRIPGTNLTGIARLGAGGQWVVTLGDENGEPYELAPDAADAEPHPGVGPAAYGKCDTTPALPANDGGGAVHIDCETGGWLMADARIGQALPYSSVGGAAEDVHVVSTTPRTLHSLVATNLNVAARYLRCNNDTLANTDPGAETLAPGGTVLIDQAIPPNAVAFSIPMPKGIRFSVAITCWVVTNKELSGATEVLADDIKLTYTFTN